MRSWLQFIFLLVALSASAMTARPTGYGAVPGYRPVALGYGADLAQASAWRGRWPDITGYYNIGMRLYDPVAGIWLSYDPTWNASDPNYLTFASGDPIMGFDSDGRLASGFYAGLTDQTVSGSASSSFMAGYYGGGITSQFNQGWDNGEAIVENAATFGQVSSLSSYADSLQGDDYDWSRGLADVGVGAAYAATGLGLLEASPTLYVAAVSASQNPATLLAGGAAAAAAYTYSEGGSPEDVAYSGASAALMTYAAAPFLMYGSAPEEAPGPVPVNTTPATTPALDPVQLLQDLTDQQSAALNANPALAQAVLSQGELQAAQAQPYLNPVAYGNAVQRLVDEQIETSPTYGSILKPVGGPNNPDYIGIGTAEGMNFDITTPAHVPAHLARPIYGQGLNVITYQRAPGWTAPPPSTQQQ